MIGRFFLAFFSYRFVFIGFFVISTAFLPAFALGAAKSQTSAVFESPEPLQCKEIKTLGETARKRHPTAAPLALRQAKFARLVGKQLLKKLDPHRLLFMTTDLDSLERVSVHQWKRVLDSGKCGGYQKWIRNNFPLAKARFFSRLKKLVLPKTKKIKSQQLGPPGKEVGFAKNEAELFARLRDFSIYWVEEAHPRLLSHFKQNVKSYLHYSFGLVMNEDKTPIAEILAKSMLSAMDPYSTYLPQAEFEDLFDELSGSTSGVGIKVRKVPMGLMVEDILADAPAGKSKKIKEGDIITHVDSLSIAKLSTDKSKKILKGHEGSQVDLELVRLNNQHTLKFKVSLERKSFDFKDAKVTYKILRSKNQRSKVAHITIPSFYGTGAPDEAGTTNGSVSEDVARALREIISKHNPASIVLDLRDNPGGYLDEAVSLAALFIGNKPVVGIKEKSGSRLLRDSFGKALYKGPLVVLVNGESASAAEVFAGAMKDHNRAILVGSHNTYGKGSVQKFYPINESAEPYEVEKQPGILKLTTSIFYSPMGHTPLNGGVVSHISLNQTSSRSKKTGSLLHVDVKPFVPSNELAVINMRKNRFAATVSQLKQRSRRRRSLDASDRDNEESILKETIEIAADYANSTRSLTRRSNKQPHAS